MMKRSFHIISAAFLCAMLMAAGCSKPVGQKELDKGVRELNRGNYVRARALLEKSISLRPGHIDNAVAHNYLGIAAWRLGQLQDAMTAFEDSRRLNPNLIEPIYNLGVLAGEREDLAGAARYLNEAATLNQDDARSLEYLAGLYMDKGNYGQARNALYSALDRDPGSPRIHNAIAALHTAAGRYDDALESLMYALEADTKYAPALLNLAVLYDTVKGDADQARAYYKRFLSAARRDDPHIAPARAALVRIQEHGTAAAPPAVAEAADVPGPDEMLTVEEEPDAPPERNAAPEPEEPAPVRDVERLMALAGERAAAGRIREALDLCEQAGEAAAAVRRYDLQEKAYRHAVDLAIDQPRAHVMLGRSLYERGQIDRAERSFRQAVVLNENYAPARLGMGRISVRKGEYDAAVVHFRQAASSDPSLADAQWELALLYDRHLELKEKAVAAYRAFAERFPVDSRRAAALERAGELSPLPAAPAERRQPGRLPPDPVTTRTIEYKAPAVRDSEAALRAFNRASGYQNGADWDRAVYYYLLSLEHDDQMPETFYNLGICYTMSGDRALARDAYIRAVKLRPGMVDAQYNLALLYSADGDEKAAAKLLEDAVRKKPDYAAAHYALGLIYASRPDDVDKAKSHYRTFLKLAPNDPSAPVIREWLNAH